MQFNAFRETPGYQAQLKRKSQPIRSIIFVKKNGKIKSNINTDLKQVKQRSEFMRFLINQNNHVR